MAQGKHTHPRDLAGLQDIVKDHSTWVAEQVAQARESGIRQGMDEMKVAHLVATLYDANQKLETDFKIAEVEYRKQVKRGDDWQKLSSELQEQLSDMDGRLSASHDPVLLHDLELADKRNKQLEAQLESVRNCKYVIVNGMEFCLREDILAAIGEDTGNGTG